MILDNDYVIAIIKDGNDDAEFEMFKSILETKPEAEEGYDYFYNIKGKSWELVKLPDVPTEEEATAEDYQNALERFGAK